MNIWNNLKKLDDSQNKLKNKKVKPNALKRSLRIEYWKGKYEGECFSCGTKINGDLAQRGRIKAGGKYDLRNCRLICQPCNSEMGKMNMRDFIKKYHPKRYNNCFPETIKTKVVKKKKTNKKNSSYSFSLINSKNFGRFDK